MIDIPQTVTRRIELFLMNVARGLNFGSEIAPVKVSVLRSRAAEVRVENKPAIVFYPAKEKKVLDTAGYPSQKFNRIVIEVQVFAVAEDDTSGPQASRLTREDKIDAIKVLVETALEADQSCGDLCYTVLVTDVEELGSIVETMDCCISFFVQIETRHVLGDPTKQID